MRSQTNDSRHKHDAAAANITSECARRRRSPSSTLLRHVDDGVDLYGVRLGSGTGWDDVKPRRTRVATAGGQTVRRRRPTWTALARRQRRSTDGRTAARPTTTRPVVVHASPSGGCFKLGRRATFSGPRLVRAGCPVARALYVRRRARCIAK